MREAVLDRRERVARRRRVAAKRARQCATTSASTGASGRLHSPPQMPAAGRFSNRIVPARSITSTRTARCGSAFSRPRRRQLGDALLAARDAIARDGTVVAARRCSRADRRAEVHQRLRVALDVALGQQRVRDAPQSPSRPRRAGIAVDAAMAREHALHVAVEDRRARAERERGDRRRGRAPDARQRGERIDVARKLAACAATIAFAAACRWCARR